MSPEGRLIGWIETSSFATRPPKTLRTIGKAMLLKPWICPLPTRFPPPVERALLSLRTCAAWFSRSWLIISRRWPSRPRRRPVRLHFSVKRALSAPTCLSLMPCARCSNVKFFIFFSYKFFGKRITSNRLVLPNDRLHNLR